MTYTLAQMASVLEGTLLQSGPETPILYLLQDSRRIIHPQSSLFFALYTARRDGHEFLGDAYKAGVRNFIVSKDISTERYENANILKVKDTLKALQQLAAWHRNQFQLPVIGITGSNGKTIVKEWLFQLLESHYHIVRSPRSYNSQIGVPLSVWLISEEDNLGIFEAGISLRGEMEKLEPIIKPAYGILTNIGAAHDEGFGSREEKLQEKLRLFTHSKWLIYCQDDPLISEQVQSFKESIHPGLQLFSWSRSSSNAATPNDNPRLKITRFENEPGQTKLQAVYQGKDISVTIPYTDEASLENAIHCWCQLLLLNQDQDSISQAMDRLQPVAMRLELKKAINHCTLINDSYSADLDSLYIALDFLVQQRQHTNRTVILSDLLETGQSDDALYETIARALEKRNITRFIGIGPRIEENKHKFNCLPQTSFYRDTADFIHHFPQIGFKEESILLKGARSFAFEQISHLLELQAHQTVLEINLSAMAYNLQMHRQLLRPTTKVMAMVKAFSYGSGSYEIANLLQFQKVDYLAVAYADEGVHLRNSGITLPIMVMNPENTAFETLVQHVLEPEIFSFSLLKSFRTYLEEEGIQRYPVHIKLDTGMHRLGFLPGEVRILADLLSSDPTLEVKSVFSHLSSSEDPADDAFTLLQAQRFDQGCRILEAQLPQGFLKHLDNTAGVIRHPDLQYDMVRLGIGLYGVSNTPDPLFTLQEVSTLRTTIAQIHHLDPGEFVGYNRRGKILKPSTIATVRIGYADGYSRRLGNGAGKMLVNGVLAPTIGNIAMDMAMLDITGIEGVAEGDEVQIFGTDLPVQQVADWAGTIPYEILTGISGRVRRVYFEA
jgi:Alr-MurF fusion protein